MALHCPAVIVIAALADGAQAADVAEAVADQLSAENVAAVYMTSGQVATEAAARLAKLLGLARPTEVVPGPAASHAIADAHRGETVIVLDLAPAVGPNGRWVRTGERSATGSEGPHRSGAAARQRTARPTLDVVRLEVGDDGTRVLTPRRQ